MKGNSNVYAGYSDGDFDEVLRLNIRGAAAAYFYTDVWSVECWHIIYSSIRIELEHCRRKWTSKAM